MWLDTIQQELQSTFKQLFSVAQQQARSLHNLSNSHTNLQSIYHTLQFSHHNIQVEYHAEQQKRKILQNKVIDLQGNIRVYCRVRPTSEEEKRDGDLRVIECQGENMLLIQNPVAKDANGNNGTSSAAPKTFEFDRVFNGESTQDEVFKDVAPFVQSCVDGYNGTKSIALYASHHTAVYSAIEAC